MHALGHGHGQKYLDHEWPHVHGHEQPTASSAHDTGLRGNRPASYPPPYSSRACQSSNTKDSRDGYGEVSLGQSWKTADQLRRIPSAQYQIDVVETSGADPGGAIGLCRVSSRKGQTW